MTVFISKKITTTPITYGERMQVDNFTLTDVTSIDDIVDATTGVRQYRISYQHPTDQEATNVFFACDDHMLAIM